MVQTEMVDDDAADNGTYNPPGRGFKYLIPDEIVQTQQNWSKTLGPLTWHFIKNDGEDSMICTNITINDPLKEEIHGSEMATLEDLDRWSASA